MSKLYRTSRFYRPLSVWVKDNSYELCSFIFYNEDGIIFKHDYGFLENDMEVNFDFEIKRKVKVSFDKKIAYIIKSKTNYSGGYDLYIHADLVGLKEPVYEIKYKSDVYATYKTDIEGFEFQTYVKSIDKNLNLVKRDIKEEAKNLDTFNLNSEMLEDTINKLKELHAILQKEEEILNNYTVEDYLNELK